MSDFPRTTVGGVSLSRMIIGTNWFFGWSHCTPAKDTLIRELVRNRKAIADILEVFFRQGVDTIMCPIDTDPICEAIQEAQDRTGVKCIIVATPHLPVDASTPFEGFKPADVNRILDDMVKRGVTICMPHAYTTDAMLDKCPREIRQFGPLCKAIREHGMIPGLSTHQLESIVYSDEKNLDVETYIAIYNSMGFLMPLEVDWTASIIQKARKPVMTIKPLAAGQIRPFQAMSFVWNTIRPQDMVTVGTMTPREAAELIDMSLQILSRHELKLDLQETRSKKSVKS